jgi:hypothetical protein
MKVYTLIKKTTEARIKCTEKYLVKWLSKGFEVKSIDMNGSLIEN